MLIAAFVSILGFNLTFPFLPLYIESLGVESPERAAFWSGLIGSIAGLLGAVIAPVWGYLADQRGRRPMLLRATAGSAVGLVVMGLAPGLLVLLLGRILFGLMAGTVPAANPLLAANMPPEQLSTAMGMLQSSVYVSNAVGPLLGGVLADVAGYRMSFLITAALYILSAFPVLWLVREQFTPPAHQEPLLPSLRGNFRMVFRRPDLLIPMFGAFLAYAGVSVLVPVLPLHIAHLVGGNAERASGLAFGLQGIASTLAAFLLGSITRRIGSRPILLAGPPVLIAGYLALWAAPSYALLLPCLGVIGLTQGLVVPGLTAMLAQRAPSDRAGAVFGVVTSVNSFAFSGAPFLGGLLAEAIGLRAVFPFAALLACGLLVLCLIAARPQPSTPAVSGHASAR